VKTVVYFMQDALINLKPPFMRRKKGFSMKNKKTNAANIIRLLAIIAIVAVIGFSTASCFIADLFDDGTDKGGGGGGTGNGGGTGGGGGTPPGEPTAWTVVGGDGILGTITNSDGTISVYNVNAIAHGNNKFVAGGSRGKVAISPDGVNWTKGQDEILGTYYYSPSYPQSIASINTIAYGDNKFVAGGSGGKIAISTDGITWTVRGEKILGTSESNNNVAYSIDAIAYGGGKFVAGGSRGKMAYSSDGVTWTPVDSKFGETTLYRGTTVITFITHIAYGGGKFVAVGYYGKMAYSSDGITWTPITTTIFDYQVPSSGGDIAQYDINAIAYGGGKFVADDGSNIAYSADGVTWTKGPEKILGIREGGSGYAIIAIAYGNNKFVAGGNYGKMAYSSDGINWTTNTITDFDFITAIAYGGGKFVVVDERGKIAYSSGN
jgi:hypothetical protein